MDRNVKVRGRIFFITIIILICKNDIAYSQNELDHHKKYWYYRSRLTNDFMKVGLGDGESLQFQQRGKDASSHNAVNAVMASGDASAYHGYYIGVLAMEYKLLQANNQSTDKVKHELFCALNAINRLDYKAEGLWQSGAETLNGFFVRDDFPKDFVKNNYDHFNYYNNGTISNNNKASRAFMSKMQSGANSSIMLNNKQYGINANRAYTK